MPSGNQRWAELAPGASIGDGSAQYSHPWPRWWDTGQICRWPSTERRMGLADVANGRALLQRDLGKLEDWANRSRVEPPGLSSSALGPGPAGAPSPPWEAVAWVVLLKSTCRLWRTQSITNRVGSQPTPRKVGGRQPALREVIIPACSVVARPHLGCYARPRLSFPGQWGYGETSRAQCGLPVCSGAHSTYPLGTWACLGWKEVSERTGGSWACLGWKEVSEKWASGGLQPPHGEIQRRQSQILLNRSRWYKRWWWQFAVWEVQVGL